MFNRWQRAHLEQFREQMWPKVFQAVLNRTQNQRRVFKMLNLHLRRIKVENEEQQPISEIDETRIPPDTTVAGARLNENVPEMQTA